MPVNDSVIVAVEVPIFITHDDITYYRRRGFDLNFESNLITEHTDFLQIRNGYLHILDDKPEARKEKHAHVQLTIYALALSRRASLPLKNFKCAWFDERDYFEFFPLKAVYQPNPHFSPVALRRVEGAEIGAEGRNQPWPGGRGPRRGAPHRRQWSAKVRFSGCSRF